MTTYQLPICKASNVQWDLMLALSQADMFPSSLPPGTSDWPTGVGLESIAEPEGLVGKTTINHDKPLATTITPNHLMSCFPNVVEEWDKPTNLQSFLAQQFGDGDRISRQEKYAVAPTMPSALAGPSLVRGVGELRGSCRSTRYISMRP